MLIETHAHLDYPDFAPDFDDVLRRATEAGVTRIITIGTSIESSRRAIDLAGVAAAENFALAAAAAASALCFKKSRRSMCRPRKRNSLRSSRLTKNIFPESGAYAQ